MEKEALTSRIDRLEGLLLSAVSIANFHPSNFPLNSVATPPGVSMSKNSNPAKSNITQTEKETIDMDQLGKEFGVLRVESNQTLYHGGQHWVSTMFQV